MIKVSDIKKSYDGFNLNCSLSVPKGYVTGLIGRNGSGKTTLFKLILGLIHPDSGHIEVLDKSLCDISKVDKESIGVVLSDSGLSQYLTIDNIIPILKQFYSTFDKDVFIENCHKFDLPLNKKVKDFSTGMKRKLQILVATSHKNDILILDEPTSGLDVIARGEVLDLLRDYIEKFNSSVLISSHISSDLEGFCDDIYMIDDGNIIMHEDSHILLDEYAILKVTEDQYSNIEKDYILKSIQESYGYKCLTDKRQFFLENYPNITIEKSGLDDIITMIVGGKN